MLDRLIDMVRPVSAPTTPEDIRRDMPLHDQMEGGLLREIVDQGEYEHTQRVPIAALFQATATNPTVTTNLVCQTHNQPMRLWAINIATDKNCLAQLIQVGSASLAGDVIANFMAGPARDGNLDTEIIIPAHCKVYVYLLIHAAPAYLSVTANFDPIREKGESFGPTASLPMGSF